MRGMFALVMTYIGARFWWLVKGMKQNFNDEMSGRSDVDARSSRNLVTGILIFVVAIFILLKIIS